jgi:hypothetical protein
VNRVADARELNERRRAAAGGVSEHVATLTQDVGEGGARELPAGVEKQLDAARAAPP